jgi:hypothetical protein
MEGTDKSKGVWQVEPSSVRKEESSEVAGVVLMESVMTPGPSFETTMDSMDSKRIALTLTIMDGSSKKSQQHSDPHQN